MRSKRIIKQRRKIAKSIEKYLDRVRNDISKKDKPMEEWKAELGEGSFYMILILLYIADILRAILYGLFMILIGGIFTSSEDEAE